MSNLTSKPKTRSFPRVLPRAFHGETIPKPDPQTNWISSETGVLNLPKEHHLAIEIGCGVGLHPIQYAKTYPHRTMIGIEQSKMRFRKFQKRLQAKSNSRSNIIPIHADAIAWIYHYVPQASVDHYFFLYPTPYLKDKHQNRRWHAMPFMEYVIETLKPGGQVTTTTNEPDYYEECKSYLQHIWKLSCYEDTRIHHGDRYPWTHFEKKYLERGEICYQLTFEKAS